MTVQQRARVMSRNQAKNTSPERYLNDLLEASGLAYIRHDASLPGKPDFVILANKIAVFVDGDFWHGWRFPIWQHRLAPFWREKIHKNRIRDRKNYAALRRRGWRVIRIWEHQVEENLLACVRRIETAVGLHLDWAAIEAKRHTLPALRRRKRLPKA